MIYLSLINHFDTISLANNLLDFYSLLLQSLTQKILINLSQNKRKIKKLSADDKVFLSFLIMIYGDSITDTSLTHIKRYR